MTANAPRSVPNPHEAIGPAAVGRPRAAGPGRLETLGMKLLTTFYRRVVVVERSLDTALPALDAGIEVEWRLLAERDLPAYWAFRPRVPERIARERLAGGDRCAVAWRDGRIVHCMWATRERGHSPYLRRDLLLAPDQVYLFDAHTAPAYRGYALALAAHGYLFRHCRAEGARRAVGIVAIENPLGARMVAKAGYARVGLYACLRLGPWQHDWQRAWGDSALPTLAPPRARRAVEQA